MKKFVFHHKPVENFPLSGFDFIDNTQSTLDHRLYSEIAGYKILFERINKEPENFPDNEYISLNHYRRVMDEDCINRIYVAAPIPIGCTVAQHYATYHNIDDLQTMCNVLVKLYPHLRDFTNAVINSPTFIPYNMGVMPVAQFKDYYTFMENVLTGTLKEMKIENYDGMLEYIKAHPEKYTGGPKNNNVEYQARVLSFLAERLSTIYWLFCSKQAPVFPANVKLLEAGQSI